MRSACPTAATARPSQSANETRRYPEEAVTMETSNRYYVTVSRVTETASIFDRAYRQVFSVDRPFQGRFESRSKTDPKPTPAPKPTTTALESLDNG